MINGNGLVNGNGLINGKYVDVRRLVKKGYVNGNGIVVGGTRTLFGREVRKIKVERDKYRYIKVLISLVLIVFLIVPTVMYFLPSLTGGENIVIDGKFDDWLRSNATSIFVDGSTVYMWLRGIQPYSDRTCYLVLRELSSTSFPTHYASNIQDLSDNLTAGDVVIAISGRSGIPKNAKFWIYRGENKWEGPIDLRAAFGGNQVEIAMPNVFASKYIYGYGVLKSKNVENVIPPISSWSRKSLTVNMYWDAPDIIRKGKEGLFTLYFNAYGGEVHIKWIKFSIPRYSRADVKLNSSLPGTYYNKNHTYIFRDTIVVKPGKYLAVNFYGEFDVLNGETVSFYVDSVGTDTPYTILPQNHKASYVGIPPREPRVDGGFEEWKSVSLDAKNDVDILKKYRENERFLKYARNVDIASTGRILWDGTYFYINVSGKILQGTLIGMEEFSYLNESTNITSPQKSEPLKPGYDAFYVCVDEDSDTSTGYRWMGLGVDYIIKIVGRLGEVKRAELLKWSVKDWIKAENVSLAIGGNSMEILTHYHLGGRYLIYAQNWLNMWDIGMEGSSRASVIKNVMLNEIYINFAKCVSWVEIYNPTDRAMDLSGWRIVSSEKGTMYTFPSGTVIAPHSYYTVNVYKNNYVGNADEVSVYLYDFDLRLIDSTTLLSPREHTCQSWARKQQLLGPYSNTVNDPSADWGWDTTPTPNTQNDVSITVPEINPFMYITTLFLVAYFWGGKNAFVKKKREKR